MDGQRPPGGEQRRGYLGHRAGSIDQGRRFPDDPADGQDHTGKDAGNGAGKNDPEHRPQPPGPQAEGRLPIAGRDGEKRLLRRPHNERKDHDGESTSISDR